MKTFERNEKCGEHQAGLPTKLLISLLVIDLETRT